MVDLSHTALYMEIYVELRLCVTYFTDNIGCLKARRRRRKCINIILPAAGEKNEIPVLSLVIFLVKTRLKPSQTRKKHQNFPPPAVQEYIICNITDIPKSATQVRGSHRSEYNISAPLLEGQ